MSAGHLLRTLRDRWLDALGVAGAVGLALPSLSYPFGIDQSIHWYIGRRLLDGEMPYVSGISTKPPAAFLVHSVAIAVFGDHQWSIRVVDLLFVLATGLVIATFRSRRALPGGGFAQGEPLRSGELGAACLAVATIHYTFFDFHDTAHPDLWEGFFLLLSAWVVARSPSGRVRAMHAFAAGALACVAVAFKHVAAIPGFLVAASIVLLALGRRAPMDAARGALAFTCGVVVVLAVVLLPFIVTGHFDAFREVMIDFILEYAGNSLERRASSLISGWLRSVDHGLGAVLVCATVMLGGLGITTATRNRRERWLGVAIAVATLTTLGTAILQRRGNGYYHSVAVPFLALGLVWGLRRCFAGSGARQLAVVAMLACAALVAEPRWLHPPTHTYLAEWRSWWGYVAGRRSFDEHHEPRYRGRDGVVGALAVGRFIRRRAESGDTLCVDGRLVVTYQTTGLRCPTRVFLTDALFREMPELETEFDRMLREDPPTFFATYADRPRVRQLARLGYERHDVRAGPRRHYVVMELPDE